MPVNQIAIVASPDGSGYRLEAVQWLPRPREQVFAFFSDAFQLQTLTPPHLHFSVLTPPPIHLEAGALIDYRLRLCGWPLRWQSRIDAWQPPRRFIDVQTRGPYRRWHHEHLLEEFDGGTMCRDIVDYDVPGGWLAHRLFVRPNLLKIFAFRQRKLIELCITPSGPLAQVEPRAIAGVWSQVVP